MDSGFIVGPNTCVCSNHFKYAMSTHDSPHPSLFMKGYPGISKRSENPKTPPRRILQRNGSSVVKKPRKTLCKRTAKHKTELKIRDKENRESQPTSESGCQHEDEVKLDECYPSNIKPDFSNNREDCPEELTSPLPYADHSYAVSSYPFAGASCCTQFENRQNSDIREKLVVLQRALDEANAKIAEQEKEIAALKKKTFSIEDIKDDDNLVELYTGLMNYDMFKFLMSKLEVKASKLQYYKGAQSHSVKNYQKISEHSKPGRKRSRPCSQEFFLTLCRLRQNLSEEDLAYRFGMSASNVCIILSTWIPFLARELEGLIRWPTEEHVLRFYPDSFKLFRNCCSIIDCTDIFLQRPSLASAQAVTYSTYKSHNTSKYLVNTLLFTPLYLCK